VVVTEQSGVVGEYPFDVEQGDRSLVLVV